MSLLIKISLFFTTNEVLDLLSADGSADLCPEDFSADEEDSDLDYLSYTSFFYRFVVYFFHFYHLPCSKTLFHFSLLTHLIY